jgi:hypothetical protein
VKTFATQQTTMQAQQRQQTSFVALFSTVGAKFAAAFQGTGSTIAAYVAKGSIQGSFNAVGSYFTKSIDSGCACIEQFIPGNPSTCTTSFNEYSNTEQNQLRVYRSQVASS